MADPDPPTAADGAPTGRVAVLHEHPTWSVDLLAAMEGRGIDVVAIDVGDPIDIARLGDEVSTVDRWINRVNAMPSPGRPASLVAATGHLLLAIELQGRRVVNGHRAWTIGASKLAQLALFARHGLRTPRSIAVHDPSTAVAVAAETSFPLLVKPNVGGSGAGIVRLDDQASLDALVAGGIDLGIDGTGLVQEVVRPADGLVHRLEMLGSEPFYATEQAVQDGVFNYCAADGCAVADIAVVDPDPAIVESVSRVMEAAAIDVAGFEYLLDADSGEPVFFDLNPYSNFLTGRDDELGFDPIDRYLDAVLAPDRFDRLDQPA